MNLQQYLTNPAGKGAAFANIPQQIKELTEQYKSLEPKMQHRMYTYRKRVIYHIIVPSKDERSNNTYDVIIEIPLEAVPKEEVNIDNVDFNAFSNCPSFIFTYAHLFFAKKMLCNWLKDKYNPEVKKNFPNTRNQYGVIGVERSLFLALRYIKVKGLDNLSVINTTAVKMNGYAQIAQYVRTQDDVMSRYRIAKLKKEPTTKRVGTDAKFTKRSNNKKDNLNLTANTAKTKTTRTTKHTKSTKFIKKI